MKDTTELPGDGAGLPEIEGFSIESELGRGGFGAVYLAHQAQFDRHVAIKVISASGVNETVLRRFDRECKALGAISGHPNIVAVYDSGVTRDKQLYLVMQNLTGGSLADRIDENGAMPWAEVIDIGIKLADALHAAHESGVLHRDVKPENILFSRWGEPVLVDFGIARIAGAEATKSTSITASVAYAPTEVLSGKPADARSDVYALAATLHTLVAGTPAFVRDSDESITPVISRVATAPPPDLRPMGVPDSLCAVIEHALNKRPEDRPRTAELLAQNLRQARNIAAASPPPRPTASAPVPPPPTPGWSATGTTSGEHQQRPVTAAVSHEFAVNTGVTASTDRPTVPSPGVAAPANQNRAGLWAAILAVGLLGVVAVIAAIVTTGRVSESAGDPGPTPTPTTTPEAESVEVADQYVEASTLLVTAAQIPAGWISSEPGLRLNETSYFCNVTPPSTGLVDEDRVRFDHSATGGTIINQVGVFRDTDAAVAFLDSIDRSSKECVTWVENFPALGQDLELFTFSQDFTQPQGDETRYWSAFASDDASAIQLNFDIVMVRDGDVVSIMTYAAEDLDSAIALSLVPSIGTNLAAG